MTFYADLHIHSKYSRATSRDCDLEHLAASAVRKGLSVIGTGDFTHPAWMAEIGQKLIPAAPGLFRLRPDLEARLGENISPPRFMLQVEISTIYKKGDRTRKVHHLIYAPRISAAEEITRRLDQIGNLHSDGRPILGMDSRDLLEVVLESDGDAYLVPAHIWTPWFSALGSKSGFDTIDECYADLASHIFAVETGLSSDPEMNWLVSSLDRFRLVSNSDAHSPSKLARECTVFDGDMDYFAIRHALEGGEGYVGTTEFFPEEGKYHLDGHRKCGVCMTPSESRDCKGLCPVCGKPMTLGVLYRVEELADRTDAVQPDKAAGFRSLIPLKEVLSEIVGTGPQSKRVAGAYERVLARLGAEMDVLDGLELDRIDELGCHALTEAIRRMRSGQVVRQPGYDGEFGRIRLFDEEEIKQSDGQVLVEKKKPAKRSKLKAVTSTSWE